MKIVLTHGYFLEEDEKEKSIMRPYAPLGLLYISSYLEKNGYSNDVFDSTFQNFETLKHYLISTKPEVIAIYVNLMTKINVVTLIRFIKQESVLNNTKIILGGPEVTHHAESFLTIGTDFVIVGEGEVTMLELIKNIESNQINYSNIDGLIYKNGHNIITTKERALIKDISELPLPNRDKINIPQYLDAWRKHHGYGMISVSSMRGCPYTCKWCSRAVYGGTYRRRKPHQVAEEMLLLKNTYRPDMIWFVDDVFTIHHRWLKEFTDAVKTLNAFIPYEIISRADRLNEEVILTLKESGCKRIWIGAESGSQKIIDAMDRRVSVIETQNMIQLAKKHGIEAGTFIMLGYPGETKEDIKQTINHLIISNPTYFTITVAYPIKGTPLFNEVKDKFIIHPPWEISTDREIDFKRIHSKKYYTYAVKWVVNTVELKTKNNSLSKKIKLILKSAAAQLLMLKETILPEPLKS
ncbi:MAG: radical SAM protein [Bacteroidota bacterium]|nr:radical SAM protein [Bacteroidota bacterium]